MQRPCVWAGVNNSGQRVPLNRQLVESESTAWRLTYHTFETQPFQTSIKLCITLLVCQSPPYIFRVELCLTAAGCESKDDFQLQGVTAMATLQL